MEGAGGLFPQAMLAFRGLGLRGAKRISTVGVSCKPRVRERFGDAGGNREAGRWEPFGPV
jgi:hypothetical protein